MTIWKYEIHPLDLVKEIPIGAKFLSCHEQKGVVCLWFLCAPNEQTELRAFSVRPTGAEFQGEGGIFLGSVHLAGGALVFHIFEEAAK